MSAPLELVVDPHGAAERRIPLPEGQTLTIGRSPQCDIPLDDQSVSRRHCTVQAAGGVVHVIDLRSANGTFVNDRPIETAAVRPGDVLRAGATALECRVVGAPAPRRDAAVMSDDSTIESVIRRRIEPSRFEWLSSIGPAAAPAQEQGLLQRAQRHLTTLHAVSELLAGARDAQAVSRQVLDAVLDVTGADRAALLVKEDAAGGVRLAASRLRVQGGETFTVSRTLVADVVDKGVSTFAHDARADARFAAGQSVIGQNVRSVMCVPLRTTDEVLGALYVDSLSGAGRFSDADLELMAAVGNQAGVALHRVRLLGELERLLLDTIRAIAATIDAKDGYTHRHSERVAEYSKRIAVEMGLPAATQETVELSALLHDVGKIAVPDAILNKPGRLTPEEFEAMKQHPVHGARILSNIQSAAITAVLPGVRSHHEKWNGTGYPDGLKEEAIPLLGRLLGVADVLDALTSARAYRPALSFDEAMRMIGADAGSHFDPDIAAVALALHARGGLKLGADSEMV
jgi:HD-GYP domain-containing protein (c-di-GMP phosphodiesterase class II)